MECVLPVQSLRVWVSIDCLNQSYSNAEINSAIADCNMSLTLAFEDAVDCAHTGDPHPSGDGEVNHCIRNEHAGTDNQRSMEGKQKLEAISDYGGENCDRR